MKKYNFKIQRTKLKLVSTSLLAFSLLATGCYGLDINSYTNTTENSIYNYETDISETISNNNVTTTENEVVNESSISENSPTSDNSQNITSSTPVVSEDEITISPSQKKEFLKLFYEDLGITNSKYDDLSVEYTLFLFDENMRDKFIEYYNNLNNCNLESISRAKMVELFNGYLWWKSNESDYLYQSTDDVFRIRTSSFLTEDVLAPGDLFTDSMINSYLAQNNLPLGHQFTYEEIKQYMPDLKLVGAQDVMSDYVYDIGVNNNTPANDYMALQMMYHNFKSIFFTLETLTDTETLEGKYSEEFTDIINEELSNKFKNDIGVNVSVSMSEPLTSEKFKEIYGYDPLDISPETLKNMTVKEAKGSYQR